MASAPTTTPERLGRYEVLDRLAFGGMAELFLAREHGVAGLERLVVVKRILPHLAASPPFVDMFLQEARFAARLSHPNVVQIYELAQQGDDFFIAMEYIDGSSVRELLTAATKASRPVPLGVAVGVAAQACAGAHAAHELKGAQGQPLGLVHRDITPHNLMATGEGHVKLLDFGIAKSTVSPERHTLTGSLKGKLYYLSPEQCRHEPLDRRSDIFSLGVVLWELLAGRRLFKRDSELESLQAIVDGSVPDLRTLRADVPVGMVAITTCALAKERDARFSSADEFRRALLAAAEETRLDTSTDAVGAFVTELCGEAQARTRAVVDDLVHRQTATTASMRAERSGGGMRGTPEDEAATVITAGHQDAGARRRRLFGRLAVTLLSIAIAASALWWARRDAPPDLSGPTIAFGLAPAINPQVLLEELSPLTRYLERRTGRPFTLQVASSYRDLSDRLLSGQLQFALMPPNIYLDTNAREPKVVATLAVRYGGSRGSDGVLLVREDSPAQDVAALRGLRFCYTDPDSTSGYLLPRAALRRAGIDPDQDLAPAHFSGDHIQTLRDLVDGRCDAAGTFSNNYRSADKSGVPVARLRVLAITGRTPHESLCAGPHTPAADRRLVEEALLAFDPAQHVGAKWLGEVQRVTGFDRIDPGAFDALREALGKERAPR